ncbi:MAG: hypothetical protein QM683_06625 [Lacrimispora sp.]
MKIQIVLASHGSLAEGMVTAVRMVIRDAADEIWAYGLDRWETPQNIRRQLELKMEQNPRDCYMILSDIKGGSVANELMPMCARKGILLATGMNLAMVISAVLHSQSGSECTKALLEGVLNEVREGISCYDASDFTDINEKGDGELW